MPLESITAALGLQHWVVERMVLHGDQELRLWLESTSPMHTCANCGRKCTKAYDHKIRVLRDLPISGRRVYLYVPVWRVQCPFCRAVKTESLDLCDPYRATTHRYEHHVATLCEWLNNSTVEAFEGLASTTVREIDKKYLQLRKQAHKFVDITQICIDEVAYAKGQKYVTVVSDLSTRKVIWVGKDRSKATVEAFFAELGPEGTAMIEVVAMDMSGAYTAAVQEQAPEAMIVYDRFHIMQHVHEAVDQVRRDEQAAADKEGKLTLKNKRWVLLKREKNLKDKERPKLAELLALNANLATSYLLKEDFTLFFECHGFDAAVQFLNDWTRRAIDSGLQPFRHLVEQLQRWRFNLLNYFIKPVSNALAEGNNTKINVLKRSAYGYRDINYFMLKILQRCGNLPRIQEAPKHCQ